MPRPIARARKLATQSAKERRDACASARPAKAKLAPNDAAPARQARRVSKNGAERNSSIRDMARYSSRAWRANNRARKFLQKWLMRERLRLHVLDGGFLPRDAMLRLLRRDVLCGPLLSRGTLLDDLVLGDLARLGRRGGRSRLGQGDGGRNRYRWRLRRRLRRRRRLLFRKLGAAGADQAFIGRDQRHVGIDPDPAVARH